MKHSNVHSKMQAEIDEHVGGPLLAWWFSYCDGSNLPGSQFLGVTIVMATCFADALQTTHRLGINPGGGVQAVELPSDAIISDRWINRLLSRADVDAGELAEWK